MKTDKVRLVISLAGLGLYALVLYTDLLVSTYLARVVLLSICMCICGFSQGFGPRPEDRRISLTTTVVPGLWPVVLAINPMARIVKLDRIPADRRHEVITTPHYFVPLVIIAASTIISSLVGSMLFRRMHPNEAPVPSPQEEKRSPEEAAAATRILQIAVVVLVAWFLSFLLLRHLFPAYHLRIMLVSVLALLAMQSLFAGYMWPQMGSRRRLWYALAVVGPPAGFFGAYGAAKTHDTVHLIPAIWFAGWVAAAWILPLVLYRLVASLRSRRQNDSVV